MSLVKADLIAIVEAAYDISAPEPAWAARLLEHIAPFTEKAPTGVLAYRYRYLAHDAVEMDILGASENTGAGVLDDLHTFKAALENPELDPGGHRQKALTMFRRSGHDTILYSDLLQSIPDESIEATHDSVASLGARSIRQISYLRADAMDSRSALIFATALPPNSRLSPAECSVYRRLGAHLKAAERLRSFRPDEPSGVLDAAGRVLHAEGDAREATEHLARQALEIDRARTKHSGRSVEALDAWKGLVDGRWSLVEKLDTDGKRLMVVHENPPGVVDPRGLTRMERSVVALAVKGFADKVTAYHLGIAEGTVSAHLTRSMRKLRVRNRVELVRLLAGRLDGSSP